MNLLGFVWEKGDVNQSIAYGWSLHEMAHTLKLLPYIDYLQNLPKAGTYI